MMHEFTSCDTFVALPPATRGGCVVFGKNADRPDDEVQEVVHFPAADYEQGTNLKCTYIEIEQAQHTHAVVLSKPSWMWGTEIGANEHGVCIGNEAVWTELLDMAHDLKERLLGMDLVRLGLERASSAEEAVKVITALLDRYGQGGPCYEYCRATYHNSFLIADRKEAWVLETAGQYWAAEQITTGVRNISNGLSIRTKIDLIKDGTKEFAEQKRLYSPANGPFDFAAAFSSGSVEDVSYAINAKKKPMGRFLAGRYLLEKFSKQSDFSTGNMFSILRDEESDICMTSMTVSAGSQVSVMPPLDSLCLPCHWFTATPDPSLSMYKPFIFTKSPERLPLTKSGVGAETDGTKRRGNNDDHKHPLYKAHEKFLSETTRKTRQGTLTKLRAVETDCVKDVENMCAVPCGESAVPCGESAIPCGESGALGELFNKMCKTEIDIYNSSFEK